VEKRKAYGLLNAGGLPLLDQTYCTAVFSVNKAEESWCPQPFHRKGPSLPAGMRKASATDIHDTNSSIFFWAVAFN